MMDMKRWMLACAAACLAAGLAGCGEDGMQNRPVTLVARESGSGTRSFFNEAVGINVKNGGERHDETVSSALVMNSTNGVIMRVARDPGAVGYVSAGSVRSGVKVVAVDGVYPTAANIRNGSYLLIRPVYLTFRMGDQNPAIQDLMDFIGSDEGRAILLRNGFIPPDNSTGPFHSRIRSGRAVLVGASSLGNMMQEMIDAYTVHAPDVRIDLQELDSLMGVNLVLNHTVAAGLSSRRLTDEETADGAGERLLARQAVAVIVNPANPISDISAKALRDMYTGHIIRWPGREDTL